MIFQALTRKIIDSENFEWHYARQIFAADPWFKILPRGKTPKTSREISFFTADHTPTKGVALLAKCGDAATCTRAAALYKTITPTGKPELVCGKTPTLEKLRPVVIIPTKGDEAERKRVIPTKNNEVIPLCVRLAACRAVRDKTLDGDQALLCQQHPNRFRTTCGKKDSCAAVLSCAEK